MNYSTMPSGLPTPNGVISRLPVVIRDRMPHVPMPAVEVREKALALLREYQNDLAAIADTKGIEEAKFYSDKADALAAWAKTYKQDDLAIAARREKFLAFKRMGELAAQMAEERAEAARRRALLERPAQLEALRAERQALKESGQARSARARTISSILSQAKGRDTVSASAQDVRPQPRRLLMEAGLGKQQAHQALAISRLSEREIGAALDKGTSVGRAAIQARGRALTSRETAASDAYLWLTKNDGNSGMQLLYARGGARRRHPHDVAAGIAKGEVTKARELAIELIEWLDAFEQALPKAS